MRLYEEEFVISASSGHQNLLDHISEATNLWLNDGLIPIRFVITRSDSKRYHCEIAVIESNIEKGLDQPDSIFRFVPRKVEDTSKFNAVFLVPTGIGAEIGGHAGDATPVAKLLSKVCDTLVTHPNVVNASDINEIPDNALYVEGSVICRLLMGTAGLQPVRSNRILVIIDKHKDSFFVSGAINSVNAARAAYGLDCPRILQLNPPVKMKSTYSTSGRATGIVEGFWGLCQALEEHKNEYDAVALTSVIGVPLEAHSDYFRSEGKMINPWGGVEALLTHAITSLFDVPSAHSPMLEDRFIANTDYGIVESRLASEAVSFTFLQCILKGLQKSPKIVTDEEVFGYPNIFSAKDISCLVIPDGCLGLPTLAALDQSIPVIAVRENRNVMNNDLTTLPWAPGQFHIAENYLEAAGLMAAMKAGIAPASVRRPLDYAITETKLVDEKEPESREPDIQSDVG